MARTKETELILKWKIIVFLTLHKVKVNDNQYALPSTRSSWLNILMDMF